MAPEAGPRDRVVPELVCFHAALPALSADRESAFWGNVSPVSFSGIETGAAPDQGTEARVAWDEKALRILLTAQDREPWATITQRDGPLWEEEVLEVFLDPVGDAECYFEIEVNPLNTVLDLVLRRNRSGYRKDFAWDCEGLETRVRRDVAGWSVEFAIPFAALAAASPHPDRPWRANFCRIDRPRDRERELTAWSPTGLRTFHVPERFGRLIFRR